MKRLIGLSVLCSMFFLTACGEQTLTIRSTLEGDQYIRNNLATLDQEDFSQLTPQGQPVKEEQLTQFKKVLESNPQTRYSRYGDGLYRYSSSGELLYYTKWEEVDGSHKLTTLEFPPS
ncbi:hypothetical protein [Alkalicoccobacillus porphyridii]|uniref:Lipoprotein n=1 Tax=Alkalicoccobacillus porphyridii TaxID=2597270 RepID=A0A554A3V4_9BACI|nr:hypothetical protein [Alkalicoccobacillus porphyridii]TSB48370.1 hypothetical protein FN960_02105 [Alkalicoccobacillus porphyridii]